MEKKELNPIIEEQYKVPNLEKGLAVLELLSYSHSGMTLQEIKIELEISQTTAYRILNTMVRLGYLLYSDKVKKYRVSKKLLAMGLRAIEEHDIFESVLPHIRDLRNQVKETVCYGVIGSEKILFIEQAIGTHPFCFVLTPGKVIDMHCSAPGKAVLAFMDPSIRETYLKTITYEKFNENTITCEADLLKELDQVAQCGYALDREEEMIGVVCLGAPIINCHGIPVGAIWLSGPRSRLSDAVIDKYAAMLLDTTQTISYELGYEPS
ncbi:MAG: IclR family transcriptional regulator [Bacteroides sp.]|nr:IclR family transcriptional regulator [Bacteroides sp.]